jgi:hypothetical protein
MTQTDPSLTGATRFYPQVEVCSGWHHREFSPMIPIGEEAAPTGAEEA